MKSHDRSSPYQIFKDCKVDDVKTVSEFLDKYYKHDRYKGRGEEYAAVVLNSHEEDLKKYDMDWMSKHESRTGEVVAFYSDDASD